MSSKQVNCEECYLSTLCLPLGLNPDEFKLLDNIVARHPRLKRGETLFNQGKPFQSLYALRSGSVKSITTSTDGNENIIGFHFAGELLGFDGINKKAYLCETQALETTHLCEIPFSKLQQLTAQIPSLQSHLFCLMSQEISSNDGLYFLMRKKSAEEKIASFIYILSLRFERFCFAPTEFKLTMSRRDIANYLGLAVETVSRLFSRLQQQKILRVASKQVNILDIEQLKGAAGDLPNEYK